MGPPGDGATAANPEKIVFFVSDGVANYMNRTSCMRRTNNNRCMEPVNLSSCTALKDQGYRIAVLYTTYLPLPTNSFYRNWIAPFQPDIPTVMHTCASPGLYFEVSPSEEAEAKARFAVLGPLLQLGDLAADAAHIVDDKALWQFQHADR
eukprot:gene4671-5548_t